MKEKSLATVLAILLGGIGAHKFYLKDYVRGVVYLVFSRTFIPIALGVIDGIFLYAMKQIDFDMKYNAGMDSTKIEESKNPINSINTSKYDYLEKIHSLREKGIITEEEFNLEKEKITAKFH